MVMLLTTSLAFLLLRRLCALWHGGVLFFW
jgi:hypothetical protein